MPDDTTYTRREFLGGLAVLSTAATLPLFLNSSAQVLADEAPSRVKNAPGTPDDRILVVVQLTGGNDGLNAVVPFGMREYYDARPRLAIAEQDVLRLDGSTGIGLNPEMTDLKAMIGDGRAAIIQGVGYPNPNRSHFTSMDIWHTADPAGGRGVGWIGRMLDERSAANAGRIDATACVCIGRKAPLAAEGRSAKPVNFENANVFRWVGGDLHPALAAEYRVLNHADVPPARDDAAAFVLRTAMDAQVASDRIRKAVAQGPVTAFPGGRLADQLKMVSSMIRAGMPTRVYYVELGGFDTHANQGPTQGRNLREFSAAVRAFYHELDAIGQAQRVFTMAFSEFGRRVGQNASNGTDHGTAGPAFLFGDMIRTAPNGLIGEHPSLNAQKLDNGDLVHTADFRSLYASVLDNWMKIDSRKVLGRAFKPAVIFDPAKVS
ncbi:MAG: DUF1501 domain-containing protein [Planctomycetes bacterium]|nr:DUF1501 domain-containing protein [Planctomycetota bacterium]